MQQELDQSLPQPPSPSIHRFRSIAVTVGSGLLLTGLLFAAISIITLLGFMSFQKVLHSLSEETFPQTTREAQTSILFNQLLHMTGYLHSATTQEKRRLAFNNIQSQLKRITDFSPNSGKKAESDQEPKTEILEQALKDLNNLVSKGISTRKKIAESLSGIFLLNQAIYGSGQTMRELAPDQANISKIEELINHALTILYRSENAPSFINLREVNQRETQLEIVFRNMKLSADFLSEPAKVQASSLISRMHTEILGESGLFPLVKQNLLINSKSNSQNILTRNLISEKGYSSITDVFDLTSAVSLKTTILAEKVDRQIRLLSGLFIFSLLLALTSFFYFRNILIARLTRLNRTVLAMVAGEDGRIDDDGGDEISEIARSVNYFSSELHKAKEKAEKSSVTKSEFLAHMSHEIRTPMNAILGFSDLAFKTEDPREHLNYLGKINRASTSLLGIINAILDFSKIEAGKFTVVKEPFDLRELLENLSTLISLRCDESGLDFYFNIDPKTPCAISGDVLRLEQVLTNLITNAFKFTNDGFITLHISTVETEAGSKLLFSVEDTGPGIAKAQVKNLFQPFTQADKSITRKSEGTGLGLAICKNLVEMMGGEIWYIGREERGAIFSFTIPFGLQGNKCKQIFSSPAQLQDKRVLVMSEKPKTATELSFQLENFGFRVFQTLSGEEVLAAVRQLPENAPYEIIFMDCKASSLDWMETLNRIQSIWPGDEPLPLVLTGSQRLSGHFSSIHQTENNFFLAQPITPARLLKSTLSVLDIEDTFSIQLVTESEATKTLSIDTFRDIDILLVEDNKINQQITIGYLKTQGWSVTIAQNGAEALEILRKSGPDEYDLVLMDIQMPVMDGYSASKAIRKLPAPIGDIPIIALTAHAMLEERDKCLNAGMNDYVTKPIDPKHLFSTLARFIHIQTESKLKRDPKQQANVSTDVFKSNPNFDMKAGLSKVMGDFSLYIDLLQTFVDKYRSYPAAIEEKFKELSLDDLGHMVHTLKGISGNLGMKKLYSLCAQLEVSIKGEKTEACQLFLIEIRQETEKNCVFLLEWLDRYDNTGWNTYTTNIYSTDHAEKENLIIALSESLKNNSSKALKQLSLLRAHLEQEEITVFTGVEKYAGDLEFEKARSLLLQWQKTRQN